MTTLKYVLQSLILTILVCTSSDGSTTSSASNWITTDQGSVRLVAFQDAEDEAQMRMGLHFKMLKDWKIYWRSPGEAGYPPSVDWSSSVNVKPGPFHWPIPTRFSILGLDTIGYKNEVLLPFDVKILNNNKSANISGELNYLTCRLICIPIELTIALKLSPEDRKSGDFSHLINQFLAKVPSKEQTNFEILSASAVSYGEEPALELMIISKIPIIGPDIFVDGPLELFFGKPTFTFFNNQLKTRVVLPVKNLEELRPVKKNISGVPLSVIITANNLSAEIPIIPTKSVIIEKNKSIWWFVILAIIGGIILNFMPCVLPVLSIKVLSLIKYSGGRARDLRPSFLATAAGILVTFLFIATFLIILKSVGISIGWGIQFQQPWFLISISLLLTLFACNLWGLFEFRLPQLFSKMNSKFNNYNGISSDFFAGIMATLLATPCSAPFVGTAVGFALAKGTLEIYLIFFALGLGLALPYFCFAITPQLASILPKPGQWMVVLRQVLGWVLAATIIWILTLIYTTSSIEVVTTNTIILLFIMCFLFFQKHGHKFIYRIKLQSLILLGLLFSSAFPLLYFSGQSDQLIKEHYWKPFRPELISKHVEQGKTVFVDITADWCITCLLNKTFAIDDPRVLKLLQADNMISMRADWTKPDNNIARYLETFGRYGIPFNAIYGPNVPKGIVLPELLTPSLIMTEIESAKSP